MWEVLLVDSFCEWMFLILATDVWQRRFLLLKINHLNSFNGKLPYFIGKSPALRFSLSPELGMTPIFESLFNPIKKKYESFSKKVSY